MAPKLISDFKNDIVVSVGVDKNIGASGHVSFPNELISKAALLILSNNESAILSYCSYGRSFDLQIRASSCHSKLTDPASANITFSFVTTLPVWRSI